MRERIRGTHVGAYSDGADTMTVTSAKVKPWDGKKLVLSFQTADGMNVTVTLDKKLLHGFCHMIATTVQKAEWGLDLAVGEPVVAAQAGERVIH